jgi:hypothetical protein
VAFKHGKSTAVWFNGLDLSPYLNSAGMSVSVGTGDTTTFQNGGWSTSLAGIASATKSFAGLYDPAVTQLEDALAVNSGVLTYCPAGAVAVGDKARLAAVTGTSFSQSSPVGDIVAVGWEVQTQTAVAFGQVLHLMAEDTNTTTGTGKDDTGATATGWTAHLHVTAVDGGTWTIKLEDSANNTDWADVTGGSFTAATGATAQRLTSAAATTALRQYVRYTATRAGGSAGNGITFALGYARTRA